MRQGLNTCSRPICDALVMLQFNVLLLPESYRRLPAGLLVSSYGKAHPCQRQNWSIRREEPSIAITADLRLFVTHTGLAWSTALLTRHPWRVPASISMQNVNWRTRIPPFFHNFSNYSTPTYVVVLFVVIQRSKLHRVLPWFRPVWRFHLVVE